MANEGEVNTGVSVVSRIRMRKIQDGTLIRDKPKENTDKKEAP